MRISLSRKEFERFHPVGFPLLQGQRGIKKAASEYPKSRSAVVQELRDRGLNATANAVTHKIRQGVCDPTNVGGNFIFTSADVDALAEAFETERAYWGPGILCAYYNTPLSVYLQALYGACKQAAEEFGYSSCDDCIFGNSLTAERYFDLTISPAIGIGEPAEFRFTIKPSVRAEVESIKAAGNGGE